MAVYWLLSYLNSPNGFLGTDTGGKVATLKAMAANDTYTNVDVGYWAVKWDPQGALHPLYNSLHVGDHWVQVTTFPMLLLGEPLYRLGGYRLTLLLPMLGGVACAYAARALARRFGGDTTRQWWAFWIIALASPVTIYALDFWEHTIGLALMAWGTVAIVDLLESNTLGRRSWTCGLAGFAFGAAGTMRTEALAYLAVIAAVVGITIVYRQRRVLGWIGPGFALIVGAMIPMVANFALSRWILGDGLREGRTASAAGGVGSNIVLRLREGLITSVGLAGSSGWGAILTGALVACLIAWVAYRARRPVPVGRMPLVKALIVCIGLLYFTVLVSGFGFVPGIVGAAPLAAVGVVAAWRPPLAGSARLAAIGALLALPVIWAVQWTGGAVPQWGGRYLQLSMLILVVIAVVALPSLDKFVMRTLVVLSIAVTMFGIGWMSIRTHDIEHTFKDLHARPEPVLVAERGLSFFPREGGAFYGDHRWLTTPRAGDLTRASRVVEDAGFDTFALVGTSEASAPTTIGDFRASHAEPEAFGDVIFTVTTYELTD